MAIRSKENLGNTNFDRLSYYFDFFNDTVQPGDLITIKTGYRDRVKVVMDFEMGLEVTQTDAIQSVTNMVNQSFTYKRPRERKRDESREDYEANCPGEKEYSATPFSLNEK